MDHNEILRQKDTQIEFDNIHAFIIKGIFTNKAEIVQVNGCGAKSANDEAENNFYIVRFTSVPHTPQEDVE